VSYEVVIDPGALKDLEGLHPRDRQRIVARLEGLADDPRPANTEELRGDLKGLRRMLIGDYRAAYLVDDSARRIRVWAVASRETFYQHVRIRRG
jgi:mRNA interferase RelE/StbE